MFALPVLIVLIVLAVVGVAGHPVDRRVRSGPTDGRSPATTALAEGFGYMGAALALSGLALLVGQSWDTFDQWTRLGLLASAAASLLVVGMLVPEDDSPVFWRLRGVTMLLSSGAMAGFVGVVAADRFDWAAPQVVLAVGTVTAVYGAALWSALDRPLQHATTLVGLLLAAGGAMAWFDGAGAVGASMIVVGAGWGAMGELGWLPPRYTAVPLGAAAALIGPLVMTPALHRWAPLLGLALASTAVVAGSATHDRLLSGPGALAAMGYLPATVARWFGHRLGPSTIMLASGVLLLAVMTLLLRRPHDGDDHRHHGHHGGFHLPHHAGT